LPLNAFQIWLVVYVYLLPLMLYAAWSALSIMDLVESNESSNRWLPAAVVLLLPLAGGAWYLLARARALSRSARLVTVVGGALVWLIPLTVAVWLVARPLGPKALN
jgi:hypothetical protein